MNNEAGLDLIEDDLTILNVQERLETEDKVTIKYGTILAIRNLMIENGIEVDTASLYLNCIIDGIPDLLKIDRKLNNL